MVPTSLVKSWDRNNYVNLSAWDMDGLKEFLEEPHEDQELWNMVALPESDWIPHVPLNGAVEQMCNEMASRHGVRFPCIQIIKTATVPGKLCKRESTKQFHISKIKFPLVFRKVGPPTRKLKTTYKESRPNLFM